jgi:hypothetical protein
MMNMNRLKSINFSLELIGKHCQNGKSQTLTNLESQTKKTPPVVTTGDDDGGKGTHFVTKGNGGGMAAVKSKIVGWKTIDS